MKDLYTEPELTIIEISNQDIITESEYTCEDDDEWGGCDWQI